VSGAAYLLVTASVKVADYPFAIFFSKDTVVDRRQAGARDTGLVIVRHIAVGPLVDHVVPRLVVRTVAVLVRRLHLVLRVQDGVGILSRKLPVRWRGGRSVLLVVPWKVKKVSWVYGKSKRGEI
jgi:hypothetical protein